MLKLISVTKSEKHTKRNVHFSIDVTHQEIETSKRRNYNTVINLLCETSSYLLEEKSKSAIVIEDIMRVVEDFFEKSSDGYRMLMAKCYIKKALISPPGEEQENFIKLANSFDPTDEKYFRR